MMRKGISPIPQQPLYDRVMDDDPSISRPLLVSVSTASRHGRMGEAHICGAREECVKVCAWDWEVVRGLGAIVQESRRVSERGIRC